MLGGGLFLHRQGGARDPRGDGGGRHAPNSAASRAALRGAIGQIIVLDIVFSFDSVITAVGMAQQLWVMATAVIIAVFIMLIASGPIIRFIQHPPDASRCWRSPSCMLIGMALVAEGMGFHIPKGYLYFAMAFSVLVEGLNVTLARRRSRATSADGLQLDEP